MSDSPQNISPALHKVMVDPSIERHESEGFVFPLGAYPTEPLTPKAGYTMQFEPADGSDPSDFTGAGFTDELEEWPDRYVYDVLISHARLASFCRAVFSMLPGRFFPILDILGNDAYREIDSYIAYEPVGCEKFLDAVRFFGPWFYEDGLVGFGALSLDPFLYVFVDEHKIVTARVGPENKEKFEKLLAAFDLSLVEELHGADFVAHEHRGALIAPDEHPDIMTADEVIERLRDNWLLQLNIDPTSNLDSEGNDLGITAWQCIARCTPEDEDEASAYAEVLLSAESLHKAEELVTEVLEAKAAPTGWDEIDVIRADRITPEQLAEWMSASATKPQPGVSAVHDVRWLSGGPKISGEEAAPTES